MFMERRLSISGVALLAAAVSLPLVAQDPGVVSLPGAVAAAPALADEPTPAVGDALAGYGARCPQWPTYLVFDALFLQRDNATINRPIAEGSSASPTPGAVLLDTGDLQSPVAPGVRVLYGRRVDDSVGWEVGYLGLWSMWADAGVAGVNQVAVPGPIAGAVPGWATADSIQPTYASSLNIVEVNVFHSRCDEGSGFCRCCDVLCGAFWAGLEEEASLNVTCCAGEPASPYRVQSSSNLIGGQLGLRRRRDWDRWALEGTAKAGLAGTVMSQTSGPITSPLAPGQVFREPTSASAGGVSLLSMVNVSAIYRLTDHWGLRAGYNLIWLDGLALAPDQWDFSNTPASGTSLVSGGSLFLHGANLGVERRW